MTPEAILFHPIAIGMVAVLALGFVGCWIAERDKKKLRMKEHDHG